MRFAVGAQTFGAELVIRETELSIKREFVVPLLLSLPRLKVSAYR